MKKVLFVCLGNICRSPLAEAIFQKKIEQNNLEALISCDSAGTASYHIGESPDPRTIDVARKHQVPVNHKGQQFKKEHGEEFDYLLAMDHSNYQNMVTELGEDRESLMLMRDFDPNGKGEDVPDPYYGGKDGFDNVYQILDRSLDSFLQHIRDQHKI